MSPGAGMSASARASASRGFGAARTIAAIASSSVVTAPPSPVVTILRGWKLRQADQAERRRRRGRGARAERAGGVLDHEQVGQLLEPRRPAEEVHRDHGLRPRPDLDLRRVDVHRHRVDVDEHGLQARERDDVRGRRERVGGHEDLVARLEPEREHGQVQRRGAGGDGERVVVPQARASSRSNSATSGPIVSMAALEHLGDGGELLAADVGPG